ncbi:MAG: hypothetical protein M3R72_03680 [Bacteroidota bacterium]|nr:hypothetical protein [Bacteroidota bacterium]
MIKPKAVSVYLIQRGFSIIFTVIMLMLLVNTSASAQQNNRYMPLQAL